MCLELPPWELAGALHLFSDRPRPLAVDRRTLAYTHDPPHRDDGAGGIPDGLFAEEVLLRGRELPRELD